MVSIRLRRILIASVVVAFLADGLLLATGLRLLVSERRVKTGERVSVPEYGELGGSSQDSLICKYFTGRSVVVRVFPPVPIISETTSRGRLV